MDKVQNLINEVDAVLRHETEQDGMQARTERVFADFVTDLRSQLDLHSHAVLPAARFRVKLAEKTAP